MISQGGIARLATAAKPDRNKILNAAATDLHGGITAGAPVLVILAAGKGTRFGQAPKCIQLVHGTPLARHSVEAFRRFSPSPVICLVGYRHDEVAAALGADNIYVRSDNPAGGTAFAAFEAFSVPGLVEANPLLVITMGDRIVTPSVYRRLCETHRAGRREADLTMLTAEYEAPKNQGKGRVVRGPNGRVTTIIEQRDIEAVNDATTRHQLQELTEGNCPLYVIRAAALHRHLQALTNANAQEQYYLTDIVAAIHAETGDIRTVTITVADPEYDLLCSDVTRPTDLALLESVVASSDQILFSGGSDVETAARAIIADRPAVQVAAITRQIEELVAAATNEKLGFKPDQPVSLGISGGRFRIAFMHPDMGRFFGPAWQMPIGAGSAEGDEQIVLLTQSAGDQQIHLFPTNPKFRENVNSVGTDTSLMYPGAEISDWNTYEEFGTRMSESLLLALGYFTDEELQHRRDKGQPLPPATLWVTSNMRRPFSLVGNAIASLRTLRKGRLGAEVQLHLGRDGFQGLRIVTTGNVPKGGFSSSSAVTVATKNAINALFGLGIPPDLLVHLACQAEYGTGVRAGSLDQATEQKGRAECGTLISSNPRENFRIIGTYPVPADRFQVIFPYSIERDREAWKWSWGAYAENSASAAPTTGEMRKLTGKAAEIAALLIRLPLETDFFKCIEDDLVQDGALNLESRSWIAGVLRQLPLLATREELRQKLADNRAWYLAQLIESTGLDAQAATQKADATLASLFTGWRDPLLRRTTPEGKVVEETGVPLRAIVGYLFAEVARNFHLIHHPEEWIASVTWSQRGDRSVDIDPARLPDQATLESPLEWERGLSGPALLDRWLEKVGATPFDYQRGLGDASLTAATPPDFHRFQGASFFRGLALIDFTEAMLKRAFGGEAVAVRVNAAGQGDFFQVHVDTQKAAAADVKQFLRAAFYRRFGLAPEPDFVEIHPGGGAVGVRLHRYDTIDQLLQRLKRAAKP
ncbi:NTP transferase domain-containing protein [Horticoccus sp. 23ND18S-11]|uniref:NTP transferase domain-containing protein n=1 Tax=Horticoccus sp. 23ND18S-11 TaxID=3391832 RepID=UPI0039C996AE